MMGSLLHKDEIIPGGVCLCLLLGLVWIHTKLERLETDEIEIKVVL